MKVKKITVIFFITVVLCCSFLRLAFSEHKKADIQKKCQLILGQNPGAIIVYDLKKNKIIALVNKKIASKRAYRPGSLFKLVTAAALLESQSIDPYYKERCNNFFCILGKNFTCCKPGGHGMQNLFEAIGNSCSIYFYKNSLKIDSKILKNMAKKFGIGERLYINNRFKTCSGRCTPPKDPRKFIQFAVGDEEGITLTPWHVVNIISVIATEKSLSPKGKKIKIKPNTLKILTKGMELASQKGTCNLIKKHNIDAIGKTGTSTHFRKDGKYHGWFAGYMPAKKPKYIIVVFLEDGRGYSDAAPKALKIMKILKDF